MNQHSHHPPADATGLYTLQVIAKAGKFNRWMYNEIKPFLKGEVLEIGSGIGNISELAVRDRLSITLSDYNERYCEWLKNKFALSENVRDVLKIDLLHPRFTDHFLNLKERFDSIFLLNVIEHIQDDATAIRNCSYLLKPEGHLIILAPAGNWLYSKLDKELGHVKRYRLRDLIALFEKENYTIMKSHHFNFTGIGGWFLFGKILRRRSLGNEMSAFNSIVPAAKLVDKLILKKAGLSVIVAGRKNKS